MAFAPIPWHPSERTLSEFSEAGMFVFGMVVAPLLLWRGYTQAALAVWGGAVLLRGVGWVRPSWLRPIFLGLLLAGWPIGWVVSNLLLALVYYGVVTPIGVWLRMRKGDLLRRRPDPTEASAWSPIEGRSEPRDYLRPF